nr:class I SAM-dependent methyltransferase [Bacillus suaedaesalsae]
MVRQHKLETVWTIELLNLQPKERVLELGCGAGYAINLILEHNAVEQVVGLDISPTVIKSARKRNKKAIEENRAILVQGNVQSLPFPERSFDKIFSIHTVYFWENVYKTLSEIYRVLKPGGTFMITLCDGKDHEKWEGVQLKMEQEFLPSAKQLEFNNIQLIRGPISRGFHTVALTGTKA